MADRLGTLGVIFVVGVPVTILVVEDDTLVLMGVSDFLTDEGYEVLEANGADAAIVHLAANARIRLVFTDVNMPGSMDGLELAANISKRWPAVKIMVTSGNPSVTSRQIPLGGIFHSKPYSYPDLAASMHDMLAA